MRPRRDDLHRVLLVALDLGTNVLLVLAEEFGLERNVTGLVDTLLNRQTRDRKEGHVSKCSFPSSCIWRIDPTHVNITETGSDGEVGGDLAELAVNVPNVLGLGVEGRVVNTLVVDTVLLTTGDTDLHLEPDAERCHALEVLLASLNVLLLGLLGQVKHVRAEEGLAVLLVVVLVGLEHAYQPMAEKRKIRRESETCHECFVGCNF